MEPFSNWGVKFVVLTILPCSEEPNAREGVKGFWFASHLFLKLVFFQNNFSIWFTGLILESNSLVLEGWKSCWLSIYTATCLLIVLWSLKANLREFLSRLLQKVAKGTTSLCTQPGRDWESRGGFYRGMSDWLHTTVFFTAGANNWSGIIFNKFYLLRY